MTKVSQCVTEEWVVWLENLSIGSRKDNQEEAGLEVRLDKAMKMHQEGLG